MTKPQQNIGAIVVLIIGVAVATLSLMFVAVLGGQVYQTQESTINTVGASTPGPDVPTWHFRDLYYSQAKQVHNNWFKMPDLYVNGTITFWHNTTQLSGTHFALHATNGTVKTVDATYNNTDINVKYTYDNSTMRDYIKSGVVSSFQALSETGGYLPIVVLAVVIIMILGMVMGFAGFKKPGESNGGAL